MPRRECRCFIQEEQLGVAVGLQQRAAAIFELKKTIDPTAFSWQDLLHQLAVAIVKATSIAKPLPSVRCCLNISKWINSVCVRHDFINTNLPRTFRAEGDDGARLLNVFEQLGDGAL
jgi:hypothetical protein